MTLVEVLAGLAILSVMVLATLTVMTNAHQLTRNTTHKEFATQKAISVLEELKSLVQAANGNSINILDSYDDGTSNSTLLTTQGQALNNNAATTKPEDPISGNEMIDPNTKTYRYERHVTVTKLPGQANDVRLVDVKVYENTDHGPILLSEVASVIRTIVSNMPPTQVYDVYCLAMENVPGWWVYMSNVVPFVRNSINDLQARNPGLQFRTHWITALGYGRDQEYKPYINQKADSTANVPGVYFYPGTMPSGGTFTDCCGDSYYYPPFFFRARVNIDGTETNGYDQTKNPAPYALADQYNNAMRYPDELALYSSRKSANPNEEMTWHLLLEDMSSNPTKYTNALVINLHGELMPFPPIRNYSDAAKNPSQTVAPDLRGVRAVTHPEQLRYTNADNVRLRVHGARHHAGHCERQDQRPQILAAGQLGRDPHSRRRCQ
jgi:type II secretory pathway pseudopilin PulG